MPAQQCAMLAGEHAVLLRTIGTSCQCMMWGSCRAGAGVLFLALNWKEGEPQKENSAAGQIALADKVHLGCIHSYQI